MSWKLMDDAISFSDKLKMVKFVLTTNQFTNGSVVKELETKWNDWLGSKFSLFVSSGSTANFLLIDSVKELYGLKSGDKVLLPACTWMTNVAPILQLGLQPIFCDINLKDFSFDPVQLEKISKKHRDIKIVFVTHLIGYSSESRISGLLEELFPKAIILDDVCESHGCTYDDGNKVGNNSIGATFSSYFGHHLTSIEGGFVSTNNEELYDLMKMKRSHGLARESSKFGEYASQYPDIDKHFLFITGGYNFRNTNLNAVLGLSQLSRLDNNIQKRKQNYKVFCNMLNKYEDIFFPIQYSNNTSSFSFPIICRSTQICSEIKNIFEQNKIEYRPIISGNLLRHPFIKKLNIKVKPEQFKIANLLHENGFYIGNSQFVGNKKLKMLNDILQNYSESKHES